jgi:hypothetical protein
MVCGPGGLNGPFGKNPDFDLLDLTPAALIRPT